MPRLSAQIPRGVAAICHDPRWIARPPWHDDRPGAHARDAQDRIHDLPDGRTLAGAEVVYGLQRTSALQMARRCDVGEGHVRDVDVVPDACPAWGWIVIAENARRPPLVERREEQGEQVVRAQVR